jgi:hypothetical protein
MSAPARIRASPELTLDPRTTFTAMCRPPAATGQSV